LRLLSPDNPIHASAAPPEAEHEIKLWFKPTDIPPFMRAFPARQNDEVYFYYKDGKLYATHEQGSTCVFAPGDIAWDSDVKALQFIFQGQPAPDSLEIIVAKYLPNEMFQD
jgi:nucleoside-diphosphate kinase